MKVALFGGSFDPIHQGHIELALKVLDHFQFDELWFLLSNQQPLKESHVESFDVRKKLIEASIQDYNALKVCDIEKHLPIPSYSYDTIVKLQEEYPNNEFYFIIGDDQYQKLNEWHRIDELKNRIDFIVVQRNLKELDINNSLSFKHSASSTLIRDGYFEFLPIEAREIIYQKGYYLHYVIQRRLSKKRANHTFEVVDVALEIAQHYDVDQSKVFLAAILHDIAKEIPMTLQTEMMQKEFPQHFDQHPKVWHQYLGAYIANKDFLIEDQEVLNAIAGHTTASDTSLLGRIIYVADKLERSRPYEVEFMIEMCKEDIYQGSEYVYQKAEASRKER